MTGGSQQSVSTLRSSLLTRIAEPPMAALLGSPDRQVSPPGVAKADIATMNEVALHSDPKNQEAFFHATWRNVKLTSLKLFSDRFCSSTIKNDFFIQPIPLAFAD